MSQQLSQQLLETRAIIVEIDGLQAVVEADQASGCEQCNGKGCGTGKLARLFCSKPRLYRVQNPINAGIGKQVIVTVPQGALLRGVGWVYLLPLLLLVTGAFLGNSWFDRSGVAVQTEQRDIYAAVGAMLGLVLGFACAKWMLSRQTGKHFQPYIVRLWREE